MSTSTQSWKSLPAGARAFVGLVIVAGIGLLLEAAIHPSSKNISEFICYLGVAVLASRLRVTLPSVAGTLSVNFLFVLVAIAELSFSEALTLAAIAMLVQVAYPNRPQAIQLAFNVCAGCLSTAVAYAVYHNAVLNQWIGVRPVVLCLAATVYFTINVGSIAVVISVSEQRPLQQILVDCYFWSFPYYLVGAGIAGAIGWFNREFNWETSLLFVPAIYVIYRSYRLYLGKLDAEKQHVEEMANLHLRTIEALALAIEAKDQTTHEHLQRVRVYAIEVAKELGVKGSELEALHAAALLHDIGKLAVPEHIISKPGRLTPEEFEKMKIHTVVGAEILERVRFPYPVVPIVQSASRKVGWDGVSLRTEGRGNSHWGAGSFRGGLSGRAGFGPAIPAGDAARRSDGKDHWRVGQGVRSPRRECSEAKISQPGESRAAAFGAGRGCAHGSGDHARDGAGRGI